MKSGSAYALLKILQKYTDYWKYKVAPDVGEIPFEPNPGLGM